MKKDVPKDMDFYRPIIADEMFNKEIQSKFNSLPGSKRLFIKLLIESGSFSEAASGAGLSQEESKLIPSDRDESFSEMMNYHGMSDAALMGELKECLVAKKVVLTDDGEPITITDMGLKMDALKTALKIKGAFDQKPQQSRASAIELFKDIKE